MIHFFLNKIPMNEDIKQDIARVKEKLEKERDKVKDIRELIKREIDREYPLDFNELSETELDQEMGKRVIFLNENLNIINKINQKTGNKLLKLLLFIPYSIQLMVTKPVTIMKNYLQLNHILLVRLKKMNERLDQIEDQLKDIEGNQELLLLSQEKKSHGRHSRNP
jgi:hypothetical protein